MTSVHCFDKICSYSFVHMEAFAIYMTKAVIHNFLLCCSSGIDMLGISISCSTVWSRQGVPGTHQIQ